MVDFKSPLVLVQDFNVLWHLWQISIGIYIWEYITTLKYEFDVIRGRVTYRWTIWTYSLARAATLVACILNLVDFNVTNPINCQAWLVCEVIFSYIGLVAASALIVFRIFAIWNKNRLIMGIATAVWMGNVAVIIQGIVRLRSAWNPLVESCIILNTQDNKPNIIVTFISDVILLVIMLVGLLILRHESGVSFPLGEFLWNQGIIWLAVATLAEAPPSVFIILDLNVSMDLMFQFPSLIAMTIAATRMYRSLSDFVFGSTGAGTDIFSNAGGLQGHVISTAKLNKKASLQLNRIEVAVEVDCEQYHTSDTTSSSADKQLDNKSHRLGFGSDSSDLEIAMENRA